MIEPTFAFIGQGKLMLCRPGKEPEPIESPFVQRIEERHERERDRHGWRQGVALWNFRQPQMTALGMNAAPMTDVPTTRFVSVAAGRDGRLLFSIATQHVGGLFAFDPGLREEQRLVHKASFNAEELQAHPVSGELAFSIRHDDGSASIGIAEPGGGKHRAVTEGDSIDSSPAWVDGPGRRIVFQSVGIARNEQSMWFDLTNSRIELLDLDAQKMEVVVEDLAQDYLAPRLAADGTLYAIRRPFEPMHKRASPWTIAKDVVLFPFRVVLAIVAFLNVFSIFFRQQPLFTAGGPQSKRDLSTIRLWGRWIDTRKALAKSKGEEALVGTEWKLIRRAPDGQEDVLAERVVHFDLCSDGSILYTNGSRVMQRAPDGTKVERARGKLIERLAVVRELPGQA